MFRFCRSPLALDLGRISTPIKSNHDSRPVGDDTDWRPADMHPIVLCDRSMVDEAVHQ
jgi:hypothetical protein